MSGVRASGVCGMKPDLGEEGTYQLVPKLKENGSIDKSQFTMHLRDSGTDSWIEFGSSSDDTKYTWTSLTSGATLWSTMLRDSNTDSSEASGAIFDSGTSNSYLPTTDLEGIVSWLNNESSTTCEKNGYIISCECSSTVDLDATFPDMELTVGSSSDPIKLTIKGSDYMVYS